MCSRRSGFTLIELLVVIAIIAILAVVVVLTLNPAQLLAQSRDANRVSDIATLQSALNLYMTDQAGNLQLGNPSSTYISVPDPNASSTCGSLGLPAFTSGSWACSSSSNYRLATSTGWVGGVNFMAISAGAPFGAVPIDPVNQTSSGLFYAYSTNGSQFQVTANLESAKYKSQYGTNPSTSLFPEVISAGTPGVSALYNPTGLVGYWPLNEGTGTVAYDQSGNGNNGTWTAASSFTAGKVGGSAANFTGASYISIPNASALNFGSGDFTISLWAMSNSYAIGAALVSKGLYWTGTGYALTNISNPLYVYFNIDDGTTQAYIQSNLQTYPWTYITAIRRGSKIEFWKNGVLYGTTSASSGSLTNSAALTIGGMGAYYWQGAMDDVRLYNRALSPAEVMALYNAEK